MKWVLILMVFGSGGGEISVEVSPHAFITEKQCKAFVQQLRAEHGSKRIDASCLLMADHESVKHQGNSK